MDFFRALKLLGANPRLFAHSVPPLLLALIAYIAIGAGAWVLLVPRVARWTAEYGISGWLGGFATSVLLFIVWIFLFSTFFVALAGVFGGFLWEKLAGEVEELVGDAAPAVKLSGAAVTADSAARLFLAAIVGIGALIGAIVSGPFAPVIGWAAAGFLGLLDYTAPAYLRRGCTLRSQIARVNRPPSFGFAAVVGIVTLIPFLNLLLWPVSVAGGTLLVRRLEGGGEG